MVPFGAFPNFAQLQNMPGVYSGKAVDGCYMPLRIGHQDLEFQTSDTRLYHSDWDPLGTTYTQSYVTLTSDTGASNALVPVRDCVVKTVAGGGSLSMQAGLPRCSPTVGYISLRGLASTTSVYVMIRAGFEIVVPPGSIYSPYIKMPVAADPIALASYFGISRQLADAYPSSYNNLGLLLPAIGEVAARVLPHVLPYMGQAWDEIKGFFNSKPKKQLEERKQGADGQIVQELRGGLGQGYNQPRGGYVNSRRRNKPQKQQKQQQKQTQKHPTKAQLMADLEAMRKLIPYKK